MLRRQLLAARRGTSLTTDFSALSHQLRNGIATTNNNNTLLNQKQQQQYFYSTSKASDSPKKPKAASSSQEAKSAGKKQASTSSKKNTKSPSSDKKQKLTRDSGLFKRRVFRSKSKFVVADHDYFFREVVLPQFIRKHCPPMIQKNQLPKGFRQGFLYEGEREYYGSRWLYKVNVLGHNGTVRQMHLFNPLKFQFESFDHPLNEFEIAEGESVNNHPAIKAFKVQQTLLWRNFYDEKDTNKKLDSLGAEKIRAPWNK